MFKTEINRLKKIGVLKDDTGSRWASPSFIIPKSDNSVRFLSDFRQLNKKIVRKPYPLPKILDLMQTLQGFTYATTFDLNMVHYTISLDKKVRNSAP